MRCVSRRRMPQQVGNDTVQDASRSLGGDQGCPDPGVPGPQLDSVSRAVPSSPHCGLRGPPGVSVPYYGELQGTCEAVGTRRRADLVMPVLPVVHLSAKGSAAFASGPMPFVGSDVIVPRNDPKRRGEKCGRVPSAAIRRSVLGIVFIPNPEQGETRQRSGRRGLRSWRGRVCAGRRESFSRYGSGRTRSKTAPGAALAESTP